MTAFVDGSALRVGVAKSLRPTAEALRSRTDILAAIDELGVSWEYVGDGDRLEQRCGDEYDVLVLLGQHVDRPLTQGKRLLLVARLGVGTEKVDLGACSEAGILVTVTRRAVVRPMSSAVLAFVLALAHRLVERDAIVRAGRWSDRGTRIGVQLLDRTMGLVGLGAIARDLVELARPHGLRFVAFDPYAEAPPAGVELVALDELLARSDFVAVLCALTPETRGLLGEREFSLMKSTAYLVNAARGVIVDERALRRALAEERIAGAALDVLEREPPASDHALLAEPNVILAPHSLGWTEQLFSDMVGEAASAIETLIEGRTPDAVNAADLDHGRLSRRLRALHARVGTPVPLLDTPEVR